MNVFYVCLIKAEKWVVHENWFLLNPTLSFQTFTTKWRLLFLFYSVPPLSSLILWVRTLMETYVISFCESRSISSYKNTKNNIISGWLTFSFQHNLPVARYTSLSDLQLFSSRLKSKNLEVLQNRLLFRWWPIIGICSNINLLFN